MTTSTRSHITYEHILIPTDFTDISRHAVEYAKSIARQADSQMLLLHVNPPLASMNPPDGAWIDPSAVLKRIEEQLEQTGEEFRCEGFKAATFSVTGELKDEIVYIVQRENIDLIVLGAHNKRGFERLLFGSDTESILRQVSCPVITIGPAVPKSLPPVWPPASLVCATTLHPGSAGTAAYAYMLAHQFGARFALLNVGAVTGKSHIADEEAFEHAFQQQLPKDIGAVPHLQTLFSDRTPGFEIAAYSRKHAADLIVMGAHTASALATHLSYATVSRVFAEAPCPVLTLRDS
jgi:nucleotide-binding universal stress UspA family protein